MLIGYARVSTDDQNLDLQKDALTRAGCERILEDRLSGARVDRPGLKAALDYVRRGDVIAVWRLDRLSRSLNRDRVLNFVLACYVGHHRNLLLPGGVVCRQNFGERKLSHDRPQRFCYQKRQLQERINNKHYQQN
jgi:hypothetical protein